MERQQFLKYMGATSLYISLASCGATTIFRKESNEEICKQAWIKLRLLRGEAFKYIHPKKNLPNVLLYGDSISIGYTSVVRTLLKDKANIIRTYRNGGASQHFIPGMEKMKKAMFQPHLKNGWNFKLDIIHFNVGLHDLKYTLEGKLDKVNGKQVSNILEYKEKLDKICAYLIKQHPKAILIFATTTPVPEDAEGRYAGDSLTYNKAALEVLKKYPTIKINDLYAYTKPNFRKWGIKHGDVHFNKTGKQEQGKEVARVIIENL